MAPANPPRRSSRIKRKAEELAAAPPPVEPLPPPKRTKRSTAKAANAKDSDPSSANAFFSSSKDTLFLRNDFKTFSWIPFMPARKTINIAKEVAAFDGNIHEYFKSKKAGIHAATTQAPAFMYRHIGSLSLRNVAIDHYTRAVWRQTISEYFNVSCDTLSKSTGQDHKLLQALYSLTKPHQIPYDAPYIVVLADGKVCTEIGNQETGTVTNLLVQVYIGRLLFELIAYEDIKVLFTAIRPLTRCTPVPKIPKYPPTLDQSACPVDQYSVAGLLHLAESTGYASLTSEQCRKVDEHLNVELYPFQEQTVRWMVDKEVDKHSINDYFWEERYFTNSASSEKQCYYYFPKAGELRLRKPPSTRGGMVTEEMGLGKTIEALALIAVRKEPHALQELEIHCEVKPRGVTIANGKVSVVRLRQQNLDSYDFIPSPLNYGDEVLNENLNEEYPKTLKVRRWPAKSTLVLCPVSLLGQWKREAMAKAPSLSVVVWKPSSGKNKPGTDSSVAVGEHAHDIVLATYDALYRDPVLSRITWKRLILDEAQVTRRSTAQVAKDTFNLRSHSRFLMTGTPIVKDIDDLRGELAFLRIWPFTLFEDGFWETRISSPFHGRRSCELINHLLSVTMIRHTKAQDLSIELPPRTYETIEVELNGSHRAVYFFILACCLEELDLWLNGPQYTSPRQIRALLKVLLSACISTSLVNLSSLDLLRRWIWARRRNMNGRGDSSIDITLEEVSPTEAIKFLAETSTGIVRDSNRIHARLNNPNVSEPETFASMDIDDIRAVVEAQGLLPAGRVVKRDRLIQLAAGGVHRLIGDTLEELRSSIIELNLTTDEAASALDRDSAVGLLTRHYAAIENKGASESIHESGFAALMKLIEKDESPGCPVCLISSMKRIALTKCGHFYCLDCITLMFESEGGRVVKCAICRRQMSDSEAVEVKRREAKPKIDEENPDAEAFDEEPIAAQTHAMSVISEADVQRYANAHRPTTTEAWAEYHDAGPAPGRYRSIGLNPHLPSLDADFLQHMEATQSRISVPPKLYALRELINSCDPGTKFCVVAETVESLKGICSWLEQNGITSVGVGAPGWRGTARSIGNAVENFCTDASIQVFLLNTANSAGLTLTVAHYVVFMETLVRLTDEMQAAARVHRIGQTRPVKIVRIVAKNTIEEQIMYRRGEILNAAQEANALVGPSGGEAPAAEIVRLFRDVVPAGVEFF